MWRRAEWSGVLSFILSLYAAVVLGQTAQFIRLVVGINAVIIVDFWISMPGAPGILEGIHLRSIIDCAVHGKWHCTPHSARTGEETT